jgi:ABC-2 type transport system ATP-binding protein
MATPGPSFNRLAVSGLTKSFGRIVALDGVSFEVRSGEILGLIGPNGAGKTTLFECLAGLLPIDGGSVTSDGRPLLGRGRSQTLFYVPDGIVPWPFATVRWALDFTVRFFGGLAEKLPPIVEWLDLGGLLESRVGALSKGQRKRLATAIGLLTPQPVLLIDEPFDGLDLRQSRQLAATLRAHVADARTLFLSIHQVNDAARVCDRFVLLSSGRVRGEGSLQELKARAASISSDTAAAAPSGAASELEEVFLALT